MDIATFAILSFLVSMLFDHQHVDEQPPETEIHAPQTEEEKPGDSIQPPEEN